MAQGNTEVYLPYGQDFSVQANGDLVLAIDVPGNPIATQQRIERLLLTNPRIFNDAGAPVSTPDDIFNPSYGAGLPAVVDSMFTTTQVGLTPSTQSTPPSLIAAAEARILEALKADPSVDSTQPITVTVSQPGTSEVMIQVSCTAITGQPVTVGLPYPTPGS